jgi:uncharacterized membrane protein
MATSESKSADEKETGRVEAFSDGVFAIAITLLALDIKIPSASAGTRLSELLVKQWPAYLAFVISFAFIGIMWINHHRLFTYIRRTDHMLLILNGLLLMGVTVVPFTTALLAAYIGRPDQDVAAMVYNGNYVATAIFFNVLWRYAASGKRLLGRSVDAAAVTALTKQYLFGPALYLACVALAWISVPASLALNIALAIFFAFPPKRTMGRTSGVR